MGISWETHMPRPRKPTALLELSGAFRKNPSRAHDRAHEPRPNTPLGEAPIALTDSEKQIWAEFDEHGFWLTGADRFMTEVAVRLMDEHRRDVILPQDISLLLGTLTKLGFGPSQRQKIGAPLA
jgi:hypothetical protein